MKLRWIAKILTKIYPKINWKSCPIFKNKTKSKRDIDPPKATKSLRYELYHPAKTSPEQKAFLEEIDLARESPKDDFMIASDFNNFSFLNEVGWSRILYQSHVTPGGYFYWINKKHAKMIGKALKPSLKDFNLELTTLEGDGFSLMANAVSGDIQLDHLYISHRSTDEVTCTNAVGLATLATRLKVKNLHLWAAEFEPNALDAMAQKLAGLSNHFLLKVEICDTSQDPIKEIHHPDLEALTARNRN